MNYLIPNFVVRGSKKTGTLINSMFIDKVINPDDADKVLLVFKYLFANTTESNTVNFTLEDMIVDCGFTPRQKAGGMNDKFKTILNYLNVNGYFDTNTYDFMNVKQKEFVKVTPKYFNINSKGERANYFMITSGEIDVVESANNVDNGKLLLYFATLKSRIYSSVGAVDAKAQVCYATVEDMSRDVLIATNTIDLYNSILSDDLGMICIENAGKFSRMDGNKPLFKQSANTYCLMSTANYVEEVDESISAYRSYMKELGWSLCKDTTLTARQIAGTINKLSTMDILTDEQATALDNALAQKNILSSSTKYDNKQLLADNPNMLLSDIFLNKEMDKLALQYQEVEERLGLVDKDSNLLVEWGWYTWIITEYDEREHKYYKNIVAKKINSSPVPIIKPHFGLPNPNNIPVDRKARSFEDFDEDEMIALFG